MKIRTMGKFLIYGFRNEKECSHNIVISLKISSFKMEALLCKDTILCGVLI